MVAEALLIILSHSDVTSGVGTFPPTFYKGPILAPGDACEQRIRVKPALSEPLETAVLSYFRWLGNCPQSRLGTLSRPTNSCKAR
jgi:hypothetical protein